MFVFLLIHTIEITVLDMHIWPHSVLGIAIVYVLTFISGSFDSLSLHQYICIVVPISKLDFSTDWTRIRRLSKLGSLRYLPAQPSVWHMIYMIYS